MSDVEDHIAAVERLKRELGNISIHVDEEILDTKSKVKQRIDMKNINVSGNLRDSVYAEFIGSKRKLGVRAPYSAYVAAGIGDRGGKVIPGAVPSTWTYTAPSYSPHLAEKLREWAIAKTTFIPMVSYSDIGYVLARSISEHGTEPHDYWSKPIYRLSSKLETTVQNDVDKGIDRYKMVLGLSRT